MLIDRDMDTILAVWPSYEPLSGIWQMQELAVGKIGNPKWRDRQRHPSQYVEIPFKVLNNDLMIGLFGELPYE
ncbi:hypothetical protein [Rhizobium leguminosarum]|uniref:hypothetical protein n=1 Tax=Rhizobium leguminosarum TaxID=384 RepID=UPI0014428F98|nr:hypothetical protein [Rhizobium leguminosarum]NKL66942.1 hypothetical protein [Rhizobium leguminosarum bv. viciae]